MQLARLPVLPDRSRTGVRVAAALAVVCCALVSLAPPAQAAPDRPAAAAAAVALDRGDRTAVAVLDLGTGAYSGAGEDTTTFPSQSVVKVFLAVRLLLTGQMSGSTEATAYRMITASDDAAADDLYLRAGGDAVVDLVAAHYGIADLGTRPPVPGRWGLTGITARGLVQLYAAIARDPVVHPWLSNAMGHATRVAADGTDQFFGLPSAAPGAAVKQGWGHDGIGGGRAVVNSTGYLAGGRTVVAILTAGPSGTYGAALQGVVTAQAQALVAGLGAAGGPTAVPAGVPAGSAAPLRRSSGAGTPVALVCVGTLTVAGGMVAGGARGGRRLRARLEASRAERRLRRRPRPDPRRSPPSRTLAGRLVRLPSGQAVRITVATPAG